ncbi:maleate isomerase [Breoghania corrubedonensis]|uniref:Maleate isomerase n=1 Tax=Breoghania corrubedonensis TaxID=665038 RepID=A0A2T5V7P5_9HYPH|nr:ectoine utilization protein EutA [Breoghania corrubedonensis]PTW59778.1 maleate isomerase [Breoghania corrubedonensis]
MTTITRGPEIVRGKTMPHLEMRAIEKRVGLVVLATDHTSEADFARMVASEHVGVFASRVPYANPVTAENLRAMQPDLTAAAGLILPEEDLDVVCYSCTSASVAIGDPAVIDAIRAAKPGVPVVTPPMAAVAGLTVLGATRIAMLTPYTIATSRSMADYFSAAGFDVAKLTYLDLDDDREMARISTASLIEAAREAMAEGADALFISCTALRTASVAAEIEAEIGCPVVTSNQATAWMCLRLIGEDAARPEFGRLMTLPLDTGSGS